MTKASSNSICQGFSLGERGGKREVGGFFSEIPQVPLGNKQRRPASWNGVILHLHLHRDAPSSNIVSEHSLGEKEGRDREGGGMILQDSPAILVILSVG